MEISRAYRRGSFDVLVLAFDLVPKHNAIQEHCRRQEMERLLDGLCSRRELPPPFLDAAAALLSHYQTRWKMEQSGMEFSRSRSPQPLELLVMEPMFESIVIADERGFRDAIGLARYPKGWPDFNLRGVKKPDQQILLPAFEFSAKKIRIKVDRNDKHQIAEYVLRSLPDDSLVWRHPLIARLRRLAGLGRPRLS